MFPPGPGTLRTRSEVPPGSGLGSSGALDVALVAVLAGARGEALEPRGAGRAGWQLEAVEAGIPGGRQDQYAAALGGFHRFAFRDDDVGVEPLALDPAFLAELERRIVICYTGRSRVSGDTIARVMGAYERGDAACHGALLEMTDIADRNGRGARGGRPRARRRAAHRQLGLPAAARSRACAPRRWPRSSRRCATPARWAARPPARARAAPCSSSWGTIVDARLGRAQRGRAPGCSDRLVGDRSGDDADRRGTRGPAGSDRAARPTFGAAATGCWRAPGWSSARGRRIPASRGCSPPTAASVPRTGLHCSSTRGVPTGHRCPRCGRRFRGAARPALGLASAPLAGGTHRRARHGLGCSAEDEALLTWAAGAPCSTTPTAIRLIPTATTCSDRRGCSSPPTSSRSGSPTTSPAAFMLREAGRARRGGASPR